MLLPELDTLVIPDSDDGPLVIDRTDPPGGTGDVTSLLLLIPAVVRGGTSAVRDAYLLAWAGMWNLAWARAVFLLDAYLSPRYAEGDFLDTLWGNPFQRKRTIGEQDGFYRGRLLTPRDMITPAAIKGALDTMMLGFTSQRLTYIEPAVDQLYCSPATAADPVCRNSNNDIASSTYSSQSTHGVRPAWSGFSSPRAGQSTAFQTIYYNQTKCLLALYPDKDNPNVAVYSVPLPKGPLFWVVSPFAAFDDSLTPHSAAAAASAQDSWDYSSPATAADATIKNSNNDAGSSTYGTQSTHGFLPALGWGGYDVPQKDPILELIRGEVDSRRGNGVAWFAFIDPLLLTAI